MLLNAEFTYEGETMEFKVLLKGTEISVYIMGDNGEYYSMFYFMNRFEFSTFVFAFKRYYEIEMMDHIKTMLDSPELTRAFKCFDTFIVYSVHPEIAPNTFVAKIVEMDMVHNTKEDIYLVSADVGVKRSYNDDKDEIHFTYEKLKIFLGIYHDAAQLDKLLDMVGTYIDLEHTYYINGIENADRNVMQEQKNTTLNNFIATGLFKITKGGLVDEGTRLKNAKQLKRTLQGVISEDLINELTEY